MPRKAIFLFLLLFIFACEKQPPDKSVLVKVNDYVLTKAEFEEDFKDSIYGANDTLESRKEFLNNLVNQKLILQDAQAKGLDKQKSFLKTIERFWEQSLMKVALDKKSKDISGSVSVSNDIIRDAYDNMAQAGKADKSYDQMKEQIKWQLIKLKETQLMNDWMDNLRKSAQVKIDYDLLKPDKEVAK